MKKTFIVTLVLVFVSFFQTIAFSSEAQILENYGKIPLAFTLNRGQVNSQVKFTTQGSGCSLFFTPAGTTFLLSRETEESRSKRAAKRSVVYMDDQLEDSEPDIELDHFALKLNFLNANPAPEVIGEDRLSWNSNYFIGNDPSQWQTNVPNYSKIRIKDVYDGIDLVYYGGRKSIKYDFIVQQGEDPSNIKLKYDFGDSESSPSINDNGELVVSTPLGDIIERKPYCYQIIEGEKIEIDISYNIVNSIEGSFRFSIGEYNHDYSLVIDPEIVYSTLIGGNSHDYGYCIAVDDIGSAYVTGVTASLDFPVKSGSFDETKEDFGFDVFILKLNPDGSDLEYATYIGGSIYDDCGQSIAVDVNGSAYITGRTNSQDFPVTSGAFDEVFNSVDRVDDGFIVKLNQDGSDLDYATYIGGSSYDYGQSIAVDINGNAYVTGYTHSTDFPVTSGVFDETHNGIEDVFILKLNPEGSNVDYSTFVGGSHIDRVYSIAVDTYGNTYVTGYTKSNDFPVTSGAFDEIFNGEYDVFIVKLNADGSDVDYSTFVGGSDKDYGKSIAVDMNGSVYVTGYTSSSDFPVTSGAFDETHNGIEDVFILKLNPDGSTLDYATFVGGSSYDEGYSIAVDGNGNAYITGITESADFPATSGAFDETYNGSYDVFILRLNAEGNCIDYSTFIGSSYCDEVFSIALDKSSDLYVTGRIQGEGFPVTSGAFDEIYNGSYDVFVVKFSFKDVGNVALNLPSSFRVSTPYPNPFNPSTTISFSIPEQDYVTLSVYDITGKRVDTLVDSPLSAGSHSVIFDGSDLGSGVYLYKFESKAFTKTGKMLLLK